MVKTDNGHENVSELVIWTQLMMGTKTLYIVRLANERFSFWEHTINSTLLFLPLDLSIISSFHFVVSSGVFKRPQCLSTSWSVSFCVCFSVYFSVYMFPYMFACLSAHMHVYLSVCLLVCSFFCLSVSLSRCLTACHSDC